MIGWKNEAIKLKERKLEAESLTAENLCCLGVLSEAGERQRVFTQKRKAAKGKKLKPERLTGLIV